MTPTATRIRFRSAAVGRHGPLGAGPRHYFGSGPVNCAGFDTVMPTVLAVPRNYLDVHPKVASCPCGSQAGSGGDNWRTSGYSVHGEHGRER